MRPPPPPGRGIGSGKNVKILQIPVIQSASPTDWRLAYNDLENNCWTASIYLKCQSSSFAVA